MAILESIKEFISTYWYVFVLIGIIFLYYLWRRLDKYTQSQLKKIFSKKVLFILTFIAIWYFWARNGDINSVKDAHRWMPILALVFVAGYNYIGKLKYESQQVLCANGFHGSYSKAPIRYNGFLIFAIGSFNSGGLSWDFAEKILVVREETVELCDRGAICIAKPTFVSDYGLDEEIKAIINTDKHLKGAKGQIFYGWFDDIKQIDYDFEKLKKLEDSKKEKKIYNLIKEELGVDNPKISTLYWLYKNQSKAVGKQTEYYDATVEGIEKGVEHHKAVKDTYTGGEREKQPRQEGHEEI